MCIRDSYETVQTVLRTVYLVYYSNRRWRRQQEWKPNVFCMNVWLCFPVFVTDSYDDHILSFTCFLSLYRQLDELDSLTHQVQVQVLVVYVWLSHLKQSMFFVLRFFGDSRPCVATRYCRDRSVVTWNWSSWNVSHSRMNEWKDESSLMPGGHCQSTMVRG